MLSTIITILVVIAVLILAFWLMRLHGYRDGFRQGRTIGQLEEQQRSQNQLGRGKGWELTAEGKLKPLPSKESAELRTSRNEWKQRALELAEIVMDEDLQ